MRAGGSLRIDDEASRSRLVLTRHLAGLVVMGAGRARRISGLIYAARPDTLLARFFGRCRVSAFTWGAVICLSHPELANDAELMAHERRHTTQAMWFGPLMPLAYGLCSLWAVLGGGRAYHDNALERDARGHAAR